MPFAFCRLDGYDLPVGTGIALYTCALVGEDTSHGTNLCTCRPPGRRRSAEGSTSFSAGSRQNRDSKRTVVRQDEERLKRFLGDRAGWGSRHGCEDLGKDL